VCGTLPTPGRAARTTVQRLARVGPPVEMVGLEGYAAGQEVPR
jgi:hypothetical protein